MNKPILLILLLFCLNTSAQNSDELKLWYKQPAQKWVESLPLGNGKLGAMVFGGVEEEIIQLNESTLWSGGPVKPSVNPEAFSYLKEIRTALFQDENYAKADQLSKKMQGVYSQSYLPMGQVFIKQDFHGQVPTDYYRELSLERAMFTTKFKVNGVRYQRKMFISAPDQVMVIKLNADKKGALNFILSASCQLKSRQNIENKNELILSGRAPSNVNPNYYNPTNVNPVTYEDTSSCNGMRFQFRIKAVNKDGDIKHTDGQQIKIENATEVVIYLTAATSFNGFDKCPELEGKNEDAIARALLTNALSISTASLEKRHIADYQKYFKRVSFTLKDGNSDEQNQMPSDARLKRYSKGVVDPKLEAIYFQYGRYLLISSSRPGSPPANLQGIWNNLLRAPWSSNYTININTQMNYWPAEVTNLSEMHMPLLNFIEDLAVTGKKTAKEFYGARGWAANHNSDIWALSNPVGDKGQGDPLWANWPMGGNWLARHLFEHYKFTGDKKFLAEKAYPIMKGAALFTFDWLVENKDGYLVTAPSTSPENTFFDKNKKPQGVSVASTMDMSIIRDLFTNVLASARILNIDQDFQDSVSQKMKKLYPLKIGSKGQLLEWYKDFPETDSLHRHASHLFGLYPGKEITPDQLAHFQAARKSLEIRGDDGTGWSRGWKINWWARLKDGDHAYLLIRKLLNYVDSDERSKGGTYANFFDAHPPFQIDGNFAGTAGMAEMLLQSHNNYIELLPALPKAWMTGKISGLKARGNFELNIKWVNHDLQEAELTSLNGGKCVLFYSRPFKVKNVNMKPAKSNGGYLLAFDTQVAQHYKITLDN